MRPDLRDIGKLRGKVQTASALARSRAQDLLPVLPALRGVVAGLRPGSVASVHGMACTSLALALVAQASREGTWVAAAGLPSLGLGAAAELGVALDRLVAVPDPQGSWSEVVASFVDAFDVVMVSAAGVRAADARRVTARVRERRAVLVALGRWPQAADLDLRGATSRWHGIGPGHGRLVARELDVVVGGRGSPGSRIRLWLPAPEGGVRALEVGSAPAPRVVVAGG